MNGYQNLWTKHQISEALFTGRAQISLPPDIPSVIPNGLIPFDVCNVIADFMPDHIKQSRAPPLYKEFFLCHDETYLLCCIYSGQGGLATQGFHMIGYAAQIPSRYYTINDNMWQCHEIPTAPRQPDFGIEIEEEQPHRGTKELRRCAGCNGWPTNCTC